MPVMSEMKSENPGFYAGVFLLKFRINEKFAEEYPWKRFESVFNI